MTFYKIDFTVLQKHSMAMQYFMIGRKEAAKRLISYSLPTKHLPFGFSNLCLVQLNKLLVKGILEGETTEFPWQKQNFSSS